MPAQYVAIRDKFIREGMKTKLAKKHAAKIYNATHTTPDRTKDGY